VTQPSQTRCDRAPAGAWNGRRYTLQPGDSLYAIARQHRVSLAELQRANGISDPTKVRAPVRCCRSGPRQAAASRSPSARPSRRVAVRRRRPTSARASCRSPMPAVRGAGPGSRARHRPANAKIASRGDTATDASPDGRGKFRWPVTGGRMIGTFGKRPDGTHNDGINMAVPLGTEVRAAEAGGSPTPATS
jgi:murein DD-endopeptidase MepM/ murein hydrolase activator NlpD